MPVEWRCCGQVKTDSRLSNLCQSLEFIGTDIPEIRMLPLAVGEHLDVIDHIIPRFLACCLVTMGSPLAFETSEEALRHRIVQALALATHATDHPMGR